MVVTTRPSLSALARSIAARASASCVVATGEDRAAVLRAHIVALAVELRRIVGAEAARPALRRS